LAYCGGGGSAKTGVNNKINLAVTVTAPPPASDGEPGGGEVGSSITTKYNVNIGTKEQVCVGVHLFDGGQALGGGVYLLAAVGDEVRLYTVPLQAPPEPTLSPEDETKILKQKDDTDKPPPGLEYLLGSIHVGDKYGSNAVSFNPVDSTVVVGCENGHVVLFQMEKTSDGVTFHPIADMEGHVKAVCTVSFHPRGTHVLTSAKDGTARLWSVKDGREEQCLTCDITDPDAPPAKPSRRPQQVLVRGSAYGDLEGKVIYTVASGRRGAAFLTKWVGTPEPRNAAPPPPGPSGPGLAPPPFVLPKLIYKPAHRMKCSPVPVSAMSLSGDGTLLALGGVEGAISLLNVETMGIVRTWPGVHDLPVTCIAARPVPLPLPGESEDDEDGGVAYNAVSASADNRLAKVTLQKRAKRKKKKSSSSSYGGKSHRAMGMMDLFVFLFYIMILALIWAIIQQSVEICKGPLLDMDPKEAYECVVHTVLWGDENRPGIRGVPY